MNNDTLTLLARAGYAARGTVYLIVGALAAQAAIGGGGQTTGSRGALREMMSQPIGQILVGLVAVGLIGYAVWRFIQAFYDADDHGTDAKGLAIRAGLFVSAVTHTLLAVYAGSLAIGSGSSGAGGSSGGGGNSAESWTATLLSQPFGQWLVGILGAVIIGVGIAHCIKAWKTKFERHLRMSEEQLKIGRPIAIFGLVARGVVFVIIGGFFIVAAVQAQPEEAKSFAETLSTLQRQPFGNLLLGLVAFGLVAFGAYSWMEAVFRVVDTGEARQSAKQVTDRAKSTAGSGAGQYATDRR